MQLGRVQSSQHAIGDGIVATRNFAPRAIARRAQKQLVIRQIGIADGADDVERRGDFGIFAWGADQRNRRRHIAWIAHAKQAGFTDRAQTVTGADENRMHADAVAGDQRLAVIIERHDLPIDAQGFADDAAAAIGQYREPNRFALVDDSGGDCQGDFQRQGLLADAKDIALLGIRSAVVGPNGDGKAAADRLRPGDQTGIADGHRIGAVGQPVGEFAALRVNGGDGVLIGLPCCAADDRDAGDEWRCTWHAAGIQAACAANGRQHAG